MQIKPLTISIITNCLLVLAMVSFVWGFMNAIANMPSHQINTELERCQEGYPAACNKWIKLTQGETK